MDDWNKYINPINRQAANEQPAIGHGRPDSPGIGRGANCSELGAVFRSRLYCICMVWQQEEYSPFTFENIRYVKKVKYQVSAGGENTPRYDLMPCCQRDQRDATLQKDMLHTCSSCSIRVKIE